MNLYQFYLKTIYFLQNFLEQLFFKLVQKVDIMVSEEKTFLNLEDFD